MVSQIVSPSMTSFPSVISPLILIRCNVMFIMKIEILKY